MKHFLDTDRTLSVGLALVGVIVLVAVFGPMLAPRDPHEVVRIAQDRSDAWHTSPFDPLQIPGHFLGTDYDGRDIFSRLLWAFRPTLVIASLGGAVRLILGIIVGLGAGWSIGRLGKSFEALERAAAATPLLVVAIIVLQLTGLGRGALHFVVALSISGWAGTSLLVAALTRRIRGAGYIEAARGLGASELRILVQHVLPQIRTLLPVLLAFEIGGTLLALGELGFLGFYFGGAETRGVARGDSAGTWDVLIAGQPELAQMLSGGWQNIFQTPWMILWAGGAFFFSILAFTMLGEGLRQRIAR